MKALPDTGNQTHCREAMVERARGMTDQYPEPFGNDLTRSDVIPLAATRVDRASDDKHDAREARLRHPQPVGVGVSHGNGNGNMKHGPDEALASGLLQQKEVRAGHQPALRPYLGIALLLGTALLLVAGRASATDFAEQTISTDRPGIPYGTSIVPTGHLQLETGLPTFENDPLPGGHGLLLSAPTYLRFGVSDDFELQVASSPWNRLTTIQDGQRHSVHGAGDLQLGGKFALSSGSGAMPAVTLIGYVTVPSGNSNFSQGRPACNLNAVASWSLSGSTSFTTMASFTRVPADGDRHANSGTLAASLSHSFTSQLTAYAEAGWFPGYTHTSSTALAGAGMTWLLTPHVQLDGFFDLGLNHDSPTSVFGTGLSILF